MILKLYFKSSPSDVTDEEVAYFRTHPDLIDEITAPIHVHKLFLYAGAFLGVALVIVSKMLKFGVAIVVSEGVREFLIDIIFEAGVALIGAAITAYLLGILLNNQQENAAKWRSAIRQKIESTGKSAVQE